jgi:transcriptional regulator with XRE-family HTH domain
MPSIDEGAKDFEINLAHFFGFAVSTRRKALKLTASELARRTAELGYPISRGAIAKIESNSRSGKVDVAELLVLSAALDIPPLLLLFSGFSMDGFMEVLPGVLTPDDEAARWVSGRVSFPRKLGPNALGVEGQPTPPNDGVKLIEAALSRDKALEARIPLLDVLHKAQQGPGDLQTALDVQTARRMLEINDEQIESMRQEIRDAREALWGFRDNYDPPEPEVP